MRLIGVPTSEVGYISATTGRGDLEVHTGHVVAFEKKKLHQNCNKQLYKIHQRLLRLLAV
jgi:hypothetical protein